MLEIAWKSFGNRCTPCFEVVKNLPRPSVIIGSCRETFGDLRKMLVNLREFRFCGDKKSQAFYWKKVGRYNIVEYKEKSEIQENKNLLVNVMQRFLFILLLKHLVLYSFTPWQKVQKQKWRFTAKSKTSCSLIIILIIILQKSDYIMKSSEQLWCPNMVV